MADAVKGGIVPRPDLGGCPVPKTLPFGDEPSATGQEKLWELLGVFGNVEVASLGVVEKGKVGRTRSPRAAALDIHIESIQAAIKDPGKLKGIEGENLLQRAEGLAKRSWWTFDLAVVADELVLPARTSDKQFVPGYLAGRAFVWDYQKGRVVCTADVKATNSPKVKDLRIRINNQENTQDLQFKELQTDLYVNSCRAALSGLVRSGSPKGDQKE